MSNNDHIRLVRLVPLNPKRGFKLRRMMVHRKLYQNLPGKWYEVPVDVAEELADMTQPDSELRAFDVCTVDEAARIDDNEDRITRRPSEKPTVVRFGNEPERRRAPTASVPASVPPERPGQPQRSAPAPMPEPVGSDDTDDTDGEDDASQEDSTEPDDSTTPQVAARARRRRANRPASS